MIERLNFYDLYGYLLPGLALLAVIWFPFSFVAGWVLPAAFSSALFALVIAYVAGHILQAVIRTVFPQARSNKDNRVPSDYLLDGADPGLTNQVRTRVIDLIESHFSLDVRSATDVEQLAALRKDGFFLCRQALIQKKAGSYAEQFQGLYALMRGLAGVSILSVSYHLGWAFGRVVTTTRVAWIAWTMWGLVGLVVVGVMVALARRVKDKHIFWTVAVALLPLGVVLGSSFRTVSSLGPHDVAVLLSVAAGSLFAFWRFRQSYEYFGEQFAATVYRDFYVLNQMKNTSPGS
jgi:hypothetical protein